MPKVLYLCIYCLAMFVLDLVICCTCLVTVFHVHIIVAMTWIICCKIKLLKFNEHDLTVDQVPPNRALFVQPHLPVRAGLDAVCRWAFLMRIHQSGKATRGSYPDQVTAVVLTTSMFWDPVPVWDKCWATRWLEPCDGSVGKTPGYPGHDLCKHVGDAVRETRGISVSLEMSSSLLTGLVPRILWDRFWGVLGEGRTPCVGNVHHSAESQPIRIAASSVMGHSSY